MRPDRVFLARVEEELRTSAATLTHDRRAGDAFSHSPDCRKCDLTSLADEAADRAAETAEVAA